MSARGQRELTPSSNPTAEFMRRIEQMQGDIERLQEISARDWLPYPLRFRTTKLTDTPTFHVEIFNPLSGAVISLGNV